MSPSIAYRNRLPGATCIPALPPADDDRIRLDVAAFVGFAERGPVDLPITVDDANQYRATFGEDLPLALDERGIPVYAALPSAVESFFDNGGRRAVVVRVVGGDADAGSFAVPLEQPIALAPGVAVTALAFVGFVAGEPSLDPVRLAPATIDASSPGGWWKRVTVAAIVDDVVVDPRLVTPDAGEADLAALERVTPPFGAGDLLVASLPDGRVVVLVAAPGPPFTGWAWQLTHSSPLGITTATPLAIPALHPSTVVHRLRLSLVVRQGVGGTTTVVERWDDLRLGPAIAGGGSWSEVLQTPAASYDRTRSAYLRSPIGDGVLLPVLGDSADDDGDGDEPEPVPSGALEPFTKAALAADGLVEFDPVALFCDPAFSGETVDGARRVLEELALAGDARPHGIHAVAFADEVALLAVPDLYHRPWSEQAERIPAALPSTPAPPPLPPPIGFVDCAATAAPADDDMSVPRPALGDAVVMRMELDPPDSYSLPSPVRRPVDDLITVQTQIAVLATARADLVGVLALPRHATLHDAQIVIQRLRSGPLATSTPMLSYVGLWHPWPEIRELRSPQSAPLRAIPPDGAACGVVAATERNRNAVWIEPAGRPLAGVVAVDAARDRDVEVALFDASVNVVRRRPAGFVTTSAHSLSPDRSLLQLSVRRLLILLRKVALRVGNRYVFAVDNDRFRRQVAATFSRLLGSLQQRGAVNAFEVVVAPVSSAVGADEGRLRVDLKIAPTSPVEFLTVTLVREGEGLLSIGGT